MKKKAIVALIKSAMRLTLIQLILSIVFSYVSLATPVAAQGVLDSEISIQAKYAELKSVLSTLQENFDISFIYSSDAIAADRKISLNIENQKLSDFLATQLQPLGITYKVINNKVLLFNVKDVEKENRDKPESGVQAVISGEVVDENNEPIPGVSVKVKGTSTGTVTDVNGNFRIDAPDNSVLVFSFIGYITQEVNVNGRTSISVKLLPDTKTLDEVVVVGYGTQRKANLTGAVTSVSSEEIEGRPITNMTQALSGLAPGVNITQGNGQPGNDDATIRIRGVGTLVNSNPLILIDGLESSMDGLNPNDIESFTVLKDAASASIYGSRAANGVILITTKKGRAGKIGVSYDTFYGWQSPTRLMDMISDMSTHMELINEAKANLGRSPVFPQSEIDAYRNSNDPVRYPNTNWLDYYFGTPTPISQHNLSVSGGKDATVFNLSLGYLNQDGLIDITNTNRYNLRLNLETQVSDRFKVGSNLFGYYQRVNGDYNVIETVLEEASSPGVLPVGPDGRFGGSQAEGEGLVGNPAANFANTDDYSNRQFFLGKVYGEYKLLEGLTLQSNFGIKLNGLKGSRLTSPFKLYNFRTDEVSRDVGQFINLSNSDNQQRNITIYNTLNYQKSLSDHNFNVLVGNNYETFHQELFSASVSDLFIRETPVLSAGSLNPSVGGDIQEWALLSYFGRINYNYKSKYLFEANIRYDGSSKFAEGNRWSAFPSFSAGWVLTEESFLKDNKVFDFLKLRASWGKLGNQNINNNYPTPSVYDYVYYSFGGTLEQGIAQNSIPNDQIIWETATSTDVGVDAQFFNGRLNVTADYFNRFTDDILVQLPISQTLGNREAPFQNVGQVRNRGWELDTRYRGKAGNFSYGVGVNLTQVKNKVVKFQGDAASISGAFVTQEGLPFQSIYGLKQIGIFQTPEEVAAAPFHHTLAAPGDLRYEDLDGDNKITGSDRQVLGNTIPQYTYGFNFDLAFKGLDLSALLQGAADVDSYLSNRYVFPFPVGGERGLTPSRWINRWTPENPNTNVPRVVSNADYNNNYLNSSYWMQDASYLRLKNVQLGYTIPQSLVNKIKLSNIRVYANAQNLLTFTDFEGFDPERASTSTSVAYPNVKVFSFGLQARF